MLGLTFLQQGCKGWPQRRTSGLMRCAQPVVLRRHHSREVEAQRVSLLHDGAQHFSALSSCWSAAVPPSGKVSHMHHAAVITAQPMLLKTDHQKLPFNVIAAIQSQACCRAGHHQCATGGHHQGGQLMLSLPICATPVHQMCTACAREVCWMRYQCSSLCHLAALASFNCSGRRTCSTPLAALTLRPAAQARLAAQWAWSTPLAALTPPLIHCHQLQFQQRRPA